MMNDYHDQKAVIYARYSSHNQTEQSIEGQFHDAYAFADRNGITIIKEYVDRALSGTKDDRPDFQKMIRDAERKQFSLVLVWKLDRFARNRHDAAIYRAKLKKYGVQIVSVMENISEGAEGILIESVLEGFAEYYSRNLAENVKRGLRENVLKGWYPGGTIPYGYIHQDHKLVPDPRCVPVIREVFERYTSGTRVKEIVEDLNSRGFYFKQGRPFTINIISRMLENTAYIGELYFGGQLVAGCATPIIDPNMFEKAAELRAEHKRAPAASRTPDVRFLLLGKLYCGECGMNMSGDSGTGRLGGHFYYYSCRGKKARLNNCRMKSPRKDDIEYAVCKVVSDFVLNKRRQTIEVMADYIHEIYLSEIDNSEVVELETQLKHIENDLNKLIDCILTMPESARPMISQRMDALTAQKKDVSAKLARKKIETDTFYSKEDIIKFLQVSLMDLEQEVNRVFIIEKFVNSVYLYEDGRMVVYLNRLRGMPYIYRENEPKTPGPDGYTKGTVIPPGKIPGGMSSLQDFSTGSTLYSYALPDADKDEPRQPHLFFLHGSLGIVVWRKDLRK